MLTETISEVIDRPILFSTEMVKVILENRKTQTRRLSGLEVVNAEPDNWKLEGVYHDTPDTHVFAWLKNREGSQLISAKCPYGKPKDELWVREGWRWSGVTSYKDALPIGNFWYKVDEGWKYESGWTDWKPSIHMPRVASRIQLRIKDIRVERLQAISSKDALAEGVAHVIDRVTGYCGYDYEHPQYNLMVTPYHGFRSLWRVINGTESWEENPWVWVVEFERIIK